MNQLVRSSILSLSLVAALTGCQSRQAGMEALCNTWRDCADCRAADPAARSTLLASHVQAHVTNADALTALTSTTALPPSERAARMRTLAAEVGITECGLADEMATW